jgi:hypothetical protein
VQHATQIAVRTHQQEKLDALRNAVLNVAAGTAPGDDLQLMFLGFVDAFTPLHLRMLKFLQHPDKPDGIGSTAVPTDILVSNFPDSKGSEGFCEQTFTDLSDRSLVEPSRTAGLRWLRSVQTDEAIFSKHTSRLGDAFLAFIESPEPDAIASRPLQPSANDETPA